MTTFLLVFSLFLNILAFFAIIILFLRQNRFLHVEKKQEKMIQEMEEVISAYLVQMKEENEEFINRIKNMENQAKQPLIPAEGKSLKETKNEPHDEKNTDFQGRVGKANAYNAVKAYKQSLNVSEINSETEILPPLNEVDKLPPFESTSSHAEMGAKEQEKANENSLLNDVLQLKKQGFNNTEIAQKLNKGKTEIMLLLKFNQNIND